MVASLSRPLLRVPRASSSRLPPAIGPSARRSLFSTPRRAVEHDDSTTSSSSDAPAPAASAPAPHVDEPAAFTWTPTLQWAFDTTKPVGKFFNAAGTKAVKNYHKHLLGRVKAAAAALAAGAAPGEMDRVLRSLPKATVLDIVRATSQPLHMYPQVRLLPEVSSARQVKEQQERKERAEAAATLNGQRAATLMPEWDRLFAEACEALNHNFFLSSLRNPDDAGSYPLKIEEHLVASFGSNSGFEQTVLGYAEGMASSGWLWLVQERNGGVEDLAIVATYGAGTLLVCDGEPIRGKAAQSYRHLGLNDQGQIFGEEEAGSEIDVLAPPANASGYARLARRAFSSSPPSSAKESAAGNTDASSSSSSTSASGPASSTSASPGLSHRDPEPSKFGSLPPRSQASPAPDSLFPSRPTNLLTVENQLVPLACLSLHEHAYMPTHGVWGKRAYVQAWLGALDWEKLERRMVEPHARVRSGRYF